MLTLQNFSKSFNNTLILEIEQLHFEKGAYWIKGENGSGKTTLFKSIAGVLPFEGDISFSDGVSVNKNPVAYRKRVSYCEAEPTYPGFLTAKDLIRFIGNIKGSPMSQQEIYCKSFGVDAFFEKPCETFSSGMLKKLALVLAFLGEPELIILDEPLITLDENARQVLFKLIKEKLSVQVTFLISSHHSITAQELEVNQTFILDGKKIMAE